jgi:uncharacterized membrane protein
MSGLKIRQLWDRLWTSYWFFPVVMLFLGVFLARIMLRIDARLPNAAQSPNFLFTGSASEARTVLLSLAGTIWQLPAWFTPC